MNYEEFEEELLSLLRERLGEEICVSIQTVQKNNGLKLRGLTMMKKDDNIAPTFYLEDFYEQYREGVELGEIVNRLLLLWQENDIHNKINLEVFANYGNVKDRVLFKIINYQSNVDLLESIPHEKYLDLAMVYYYQIPEELFTNASALIRNRDLKMWGITKEELFCDAKENTPRLLPLECKSMAHMLRELFSESSKHDICEEQIEGMFEQDAAVPMYVLSNKKKYYGAASILYPDALKKLSQKFNSSLYILPSSIHECIIIPVSEEYSKVQLSDMVKEINQTQVPKQEILSDHVYFYNREMDLINM